MSSWKTTLDLQLSGVYHTLQHVVPLMRHNGWGRIVNVSSNVAEDGIPGTGAYAAAKAGLHGLTRVLARELGPVGILSNVVMPGFTLTERNRDQFSQEMQAALAQQTPTGRLTRPEDVAALIVFLGSAANGQVNEWGSHPLHWWHLSLRNDGTPAGSASHLGGQTQPLSRRMM